jgi:hypothetical protein
MNAELVVLENTGSGGRGREEEWNDMLGLEGWSGEEGVIEE